MQRSVLLIPAHSQFENRLRTDRLLKCLSCIVSLDNVLLQRWVDFTVVPGKLNCYLALCPHCAETPPLLSWRIASLMWLTSCAFAKWLTTFGVESEILMLSMT